MISLTKVTLGTARAISSTHVEGKISAKMNFRASYNWSIFIIHLVICNAWKSRIEDTYTLVIEMEQESDPIFPLHLNYSSYLNIILDEPKINVLTTEMQSMISSMKRLTTRNGQINRVHLMSQFNWVEICNCSTSEIFINPNWTYETKYLKIIHGNLTKLPNHLNVLKNLETLQLYHNQIEVIEMAEFNGLNKLDNLQLLNNKIIEIQATLQSPVLLPKLRIIDVSGNRLVDINFEHWNTTSLQIIYLEKNQLQIALSFPNKFPALKSVGIYENPFNCQWLESTMKELKTRNVNYFYESFIKCDKNGPTFDELVRRALLKETFTTISFLQKSQSKLQDHLVKRIINLESITSNATTIIGKFKEQNLTLYNNYMQIEDKFSQLSTNTTLKADKLQAETKSELIKITDEASKKEKQLKEALSSLENSIKSEILNISKTIHLNKFESNKTFELLHKKNDELKAQIETISENNLSKTENLSTELRSVLANITRATTKTEQQIKEVESTLNLRLESLQTSILNESNKRHEASEQELVKIRQSIMQLDQQTSRPEVNKMEQQLKYLIGNLENSIKSETLNISKTLNSLKFDNTKKHESMEQQFEEVKKSYELQLEKLQELILNFTMLEDGSHGNHEFKQMLEEMQNQQNARYKIMLGVLGVFCCIYLTKKIYNCVAYPKTKQDTRENEIQIRTFVEADQQTMAHVLANTEMQKFS